MNIIERIHEEAFRRAENYRGARGPLIEILVQVEAKRVFERYGYASLFKYCLDFLKLGEDEACTLIAIARKSRDVPEIKELVDQGKLTISNARRIAPLVNADNKDLWLEKAQTLSQSKLLQEIVKVKPEAGVTESIRPVAANVWSIQLCGNDETHALWERANDVMAQKWGNSPTKSEILTAALNALLEKEDPIRKAKRAAERAEREHRAQNAKRAPGASNRREQKAHPAIPAATQLKPISQINREPIPAHILHQVHLRDKGQCRHVDGRGFRCESRRFLEVHHILHRAQGGTNAPPNLITLCSTHHSFAHQEYPVRTGYQRNVPGREEPGGASTPGPKKATHYPNLLRRTPGQPRPGIFDATDLKVPL